MIHASKLKNSAMKEPILPKCHTCRTNIPPMDKRKTKMEKWKGYICKWINLIIWKKLPLWWCWWWWSLWFCYLFVRVPSVVGMERSSPLLTTPKDHADRTFKDISSTPSICGKKRISSLKQLDDLKECVIIEGSLELVFIENKTSLEWEKYSFPNLIQITGFLLVYRVAGLHSLGQLFPNLSVIRGMERHQNYALVIYEAQDLQNVGLARLTRILKGSVRIQNNFNLCNVDTVHWSIITRENIFDNVVKNNNDLCRPCEAAANCQEIDNSKRCWTPNTCQHVCKKNCSGECTASGDHCCHAQCAGGCSEPENDSKCYACLHYAVYKKCTKSCSSGHYQYLGYRCITETQCLEKKNHLLFKPVDGPHQCVSECPPGFERPLNSNSRHCHRCDGRCDKNCSRQLVNTVADAQKLTDCTRIVGSLIISITGGRNIAKELEKSLGKIEEVTEHVRVFTTNALLSLNFLKNLRVIGGKDLYENRYALDVHGNENLEEIWSWENHPDFTITNKDAKVLFHSNPKLCYEKIEELITRIGRQNMTEFNMNLTNGNKVTCTNVELHISVRAIWDDYIKGVIEVEWITPRINDDDRMLTGYYIYYKPAKEASTSYYTGRDACDDDWTKVYKEVNPTDRHSSERLENLEPNTLYAIYVQTDTVLGANSGAKSKIYYVTTKPYHSSSPRNVRVIGSPDINSVKIEWEEPALAYGNITRYIVRVQPKPRPKKPMDICSSNASKLRYQKNVLHHKPESVTTTHSSTVEPTSGREGISSEKCCPCSSGSPPEDPLQDIDFEDRLYSYMYPIRAGRRKRSMEPYDYSENKFHSKSFPGTNHTVAMRSTSPDSNPFRVKECNITIDSPKHFNTTERNITIDNLKHFSQYLVEVAACHEWCSGNWKGLVVTTKNKPGASVVTDINPGNKSKTGTIDISWSPPADPNGEILGYTINFTQNDSASNRKPKLLCYSSKECEENNKTVQVTLEPGRYSLKIETHTTSWGDDAVSDPLMVEILGESNGGIDIDIWILICIPVLTILLAVIAFFLCKKRMPKSAIYENPHYQETVPSALTQQIYDMIDKKYILDPEDLIIGSEEIGRGKFGLVLKGDLRLKTGLVPVAVKQVNRYQSRNDILQEAQLMLKLKCYHLLPAYGVVPGPDSVKLVMELMTGDLKKYLKSLKVEDHDIFSVLTADRVCAMGVQIADGMAYLACHRIVHRDLAARNCLLDEQQNIKISDFGMTRLTDNNYYRTRETKYFPVRWLPPEYLISHMFTNQSDVWSFGIVMWEILSGGAKPYKHLLDDSLVSEQVRQGFTLESCLPRDTPGYLAKIVTSCWRFRPSSRPHFPQLVEALFPYTSPCFSQHFRMVSFYHKTECQEYKKKLDSLVDLDDTDITTPLTPPPLDSWNPPTGPPLPMRQQGILNWRPFQIRNPSVPRHMPRSRNSQDFSLNQQFVKNGEEEISKDSDESHGNTADSAAYDAGGMYDTCETDVPIMKEPSTLKKGISSGANLNPSELWRILSKNLKSSSQLGLSNRDGREGECLVPVSQAQTFPRTKPLSSSPPGNVTVRLNRRGIPSSSLTSHLTSQNDNVPGVKVL